MRLSSGLSRTFLVVVLVAVIVGSAVLVVRVRDATHPARVLAKGENVGAILARMEEVRFPAADGLSLAGWLAPGEAGGRAIVLCHDFGGNKESMVHLAILLQRAGFTVLSFDFRGHGGSDGDGSTLGIAEKRDVLGAVDFLGRRRGVDRDHVGVYGVGMGAFAAALAAADRPTLRVLVLDSLYPDVDYPLVRRVYQGWPFGVAHLGFLPRALFDLEHRGAGADERAADALPALAGRAFLLVAPAGDAALSAEMERMYRSVPERRDIEGNLITLPATPATGLYGADLERYLDRISTFFRTRLAPA
jgi:pimeloyl-ACP methyl ester carboxylesterase